MAGIKRGFLILSMTFLAGCGGSKVVNHTILDYTHTAHGAYMLNVATDASHKDSLNLLFVAQYFAPEEVALQADSFQAFWGDSKVPVRLFQADGQSQYHAGVNASGAGPFASIVVGAIRDERKEMLESLRYSMVLTVTSPKGDSVIERIPMKGSLKLGKL